MAKKERDIVFSFSSDKPMPKHCFDKKGNFVGNKSSVGDGWIRIKLDKSGRNGKFVTLVSGFDEGVDIRELCSAIKKRAGCGGSVKEGQIEVQGDKRELVEAYLQEKGFKTKRSS